MIEREKVEGIVLIYTPAEDYLNERQRVAYKEHGEKLIRWLAEMGKDPEKLEGYAYDTYATYANIICQFHRYVWDKEGGFTLDLSHEQADEYLRGLILGVEIRAGVALPAECECPADIHGEHDCKHKVAVAAIGGPTVLNAAVKYETPAITNTPQAETVADKLRADGGVSAEADLAEEECDCANLSGFPCWPCYRSDRRDLPE